jgi:hypothetical protein
MIIPRNNRDHLRSLGQITLHSIKEGSAKI